jgi:hypothetical protein
MVNHQQAEGEWPAGLKHDLFRRDQLKLYTGGRGCRRSGLWKYEKVNQAIE